MAERDVVVQAAGSMPGDLQMLWRARDPKQYHVEYGYSCMGYEIAGGLGAKLADPEREVFVLVGDGSYLMMAQEIVTAVAERIKLNIVIVDNHGFASIGSLSESLGSQRFGTSYRYRDPDSGLLDGDILPVDLAANAASLGADVLRARTVAEFRDCLERARASDRTTVVYVETDPLAPVPSAESWWDVPVSEISALESTQKAARGLRGSQARPATLSLKEGQQVMRSIQHRTAGSATAGGPGPVRPGLRRPPPRAHALPDRYLATEGPGVRHIRCQRRHRTCRDSEHGRWRQRSSRSLPSSSPPAAVPAGSRPRKRDRG